MAGMCGMRSLTMMKQVKEYLASRRAMGFELRGAGYQLHAFARFAKENGHTGSVTTSLLLQWVQATKMPGPVTAARRVEVLRPFLRHCRQFDPSCPMLPLALCGRGHRRISPHIYTEAEIAELLTAASEFKPDGLRPLTYVTLFGLLAATGMRVSEALHLEQADLNVKQSTLTVRETKFKKSRLIPIHISTVKAMVRYANMTADIPRQAGVKTFFLTAAGRSVPHRTVHHVFDALRRRLGWVARGGHPQPRIHDMRHTFICRALLRGQQENQVDHVVDAIATYVGHTKVSDTYWYVSATPELMGIASGRFARFSSGDCE
jgi:integrase